MKELGFVNVEKVKTHSQGVKARETIKNGPKRRVSIDLIYPKRKHIYPLSVSTNIRRLKIIHGQNKQATYTLRGLPRREDSFGCTAQGITKAHTDNENDQHHLRNNIQRTSLSQVARIAYNGD
jgi:hypothetical protein